MLPGLKITFRSDQLPYLSSVTVLFLLLLFPLGGPNPMLREIQYCPVPDYGDAMVV